MAATRLQDLLRTLTGRDLRRSRQRAGGTAAIEDLAAECDRLLASDGEASSLSHAHAVFDLYHRLRPEHRERFFDMLLQRYGPDPGRIDAAYGAYRQARSPESAQALFEACEPPRQELLRRLNLPTGGTAELVAMRTDLLELLARRGDLAPVDADFRHLLASWFNRGFLLLQRIDWHSSAAVLEKLMHYEAVHAIRGWDDLRRRLDSRDRRCFGFFHPALGEEPLIFVEVALTAAIPARTQSVLDAEVGEISAEQATTAAFFGISNCQHGLRGISFGNFLIKQVVRELGQELANLETFVTLSPVPGFSDWLSRLRRGELDAPELDDDQRAVLEHLDTPDWPQRHGDDDDLRATVLGLAAHYLVNAKNPRGLPLNPVARFHLVNGARMERLNWLGDVSDKGLREGSGLMVNYVYDLREIDQNHERIVNEGTVATSASVRRLLRQGRRRP